MYCKKKCTEWPHVKIVKNTHLPLGVKILGRQRVKGQKEVHVSPWCLLMEQPKQHVRFPTT
jgi:hypothetical protein